MGEVYEAVQEPLARKVALKTIRQEIALDPAALARFRREAETAASLGHPNIVQVTDFQSLPGEPAFLVMELLEGRELSDVIEAERKLEPGRAAFIALQMLSGLAAAHKAGIVHRDVKPGNVFLLSTFAVRDLVKIVDFGIAKLVVDIAATSQRKLTDFGQVLGTFAYMAPEQAIGADVDPRTDLFAVGATLFHALSGLRPTEAMVPGKARVPLGTVAPWIDPRLAAVVDRAMERIPAARFASAEEMAEALARFAQDGDPSPASETLRDAPRFSDETKGSLSAVVEPVPATVTFGGTQPLPPIRISQAPTATPSYAPPSPISAPLSGQRLSGPAPPPPPPAASATWLPWLATALFVFGLLVAGAAAMLHALRGRSASGSREAIEQRWLEQAKLPRCPSPETCTTRREGKVTYPVCTRSAAMGPLEVGTFVLATEGDRAYLGVVSSQSADAVHYVVREVTGDAVADLTVDDLHRLCDGAAKR